MNREEYETLVNTIRDGLDDTSRALQAENFLNLISNYNDTLTNLEEREAEIKRLENEREELLKTNGKLFQQIGFETKKEEIKVPQSQQEETIKLSDIINEKGEMI